MAHRNGSPVSEEEIVKALTTLRKHQLNNQSGPSFSGFDRSSLLAPGSYNRKEFNLDRECGYTRVPTLEQYNHMYCRGGIAARVVDIWPDECWAVYPDLYETEDKRITKFDRVWKALEKKALPWHFIHRADRLSGVCSFGALLLGFDDGQPLNTPPPNIDPITGEGKEITKEVNLNYVRAFGQNLVQVTKVDGNVNSPRFQFPTEYQISTSTGSPILDASGISSAADGRQDLTVHWTRIQHLADNCKSSVIYGTPRLEAVLNLIHDIHKVQGGSAETFIKAGFPILSFETYPDIAGEAAIDFDDVKAQVELFERGFQRFFANVGGKWVALNPQVASPKDHLSVLFDMLCATIGVPTRIFFGTESAHLASTQDSGTWKDRVRGRQTTYLEPMVVRPFVDRLQAVGVLPRVKEYILSWRDLRALSDLDRANVALKQTQALMQYIVGGVEGIYEFKMFLTNVMGYSEDQADAIVAVRQRKEIGPLPIPGGSVGQGGGRFGKPAADSGKPPGMPASAP